MSMSYENKFGEKVIVSQSDYTLDSVDTISYNEITKVINPFDLNITRNNPYLDDEKNKSCFLNIKTVDENILVIFKTDYIPDFISYYESVYDYINDEYPNLFGMGVLNFDLLNDDNQLVLMYGTSIIILDVDTFEVLKYTSSDKIRNFGIKLSCKNNGYIVEDDEHNFICFDKNLNVINDK